MNHSRKNNLVALVPQAGLSVVELLEEAIAEVEQTPTKKALILLFDEGTETIDVRYLHTCMDTPQLLGWMDIGRERIKKDCRL